jgi:hypothetical protein
MKWGGGNSGFNPFQGMALHQQQPFMMARMQSGMMNGVMPPHDGWNAKWNDAQRDGRNAKCYDVPRNGQNAEWNDAQYDGRNAKWNDDEWNAKWNDNEWYDASQNLGRGYGHRCKSESG